jgi:hypothetical protein
MSFRPHIELWIDNKLVEFSEPPLVLFTYAHTELHNPTKYINGHTKTLTVDGTPKNNQIFGCFGNMNRVLEYADGKYTGAYFNPSRKIDFVLLRNSEPIERGYVKLDKVIKQGQTIKYEITLYQGLGQMLYNLTYDADGEQLKLSDLKYDYDIDLTVTHSTIRDAWDYLNGDRSEGSIYDFINFAPCYNGIPSDFAADKVAINTEMYSDVWGDVSASSNDGYGDVNGWILGELPKEYDEWQMKDLRTYFQRPVIRYKELFNACCKPENNGGYDVDLDDEFFSSTNPYWEDSWLTLPLINEMVVDDEIDISVIEDKGKYFINGPEDGETVSVTIPFMAYVTADSSEPELRTYYKYSYASVGAGTYFQGFSDAVRYIQLLAYDSSGNIIGASDVKAFHSAKTAGSLYDYKKEYDTTLIDVVGVYKKDGDMYKFVSDDVDSFDFTVSNVKFGNGVYFKFVEKWLVVNTGTYIATENTLFGRGKVFTANEWLLDIYADNAVVKTYKEGHRITQKTLLNSEHTPCDYLLNYLKHFNLHIWVDNVEKKVYIRQRKNYFTGNKVSICDRIDRSSDVSITPLMFDAKYYVFADNIDSNLHLNRMYKDNYGFDYGIQKINTNYNFDSSTKKLIENNVFKGCICQRAKSRYYTDLYLTDWASNTPIPPFVMDGFKTYLFNDEGDTKENVDVTPKIPDRNAKWYDKKHYDIFPKPDFRDKDGKMVDGANVLLFFNGMQEMKNSDGEYMQFYVTDDIPEFEQLNDGEPCWIMGGLHNHSTKVNHMPVFSRYYTNENDWIVYSWDFGTPRELYIDGWNIDESSCIYNRFWKSYMNDELDVNTREVDCKVWFRGRVNPDMLQNFVYFDGCYWLIKEIVDYDITSQNPTKVKMVKINDLNNYLT